MTSFAAIGILITLSYVVAGQTHSAGESRTKVILLGTGTPFADPDKSGPAYALVVDHMVYLVDCGPGIVRRAAQAFRNGEIDLSVERLDKVFLTHLHSDHTAGLPDLFLTPAVLGRQSPLKIFGPVGTGAMGRRIAEAYQEDIHVRTKGAEGADSVSYIIRSFENKVGLVYQDEHVKVFAFKVKHGSWTEAYGYRFDTADGKRIVLSGDCTYSEELITQCDGCDLLIHEVYSIEGLSGRPEQWKKYHSQFHTSSAQLADLALLARPKKLVLTHQLTWGFGDKNVYNEVTTRYKGNVISGKDLDVLEVR